MRTKKVKKPYPKSYILAAVLFGALLCGIWTLYGVMYMKDSQISKHCSLGIMANEITSKVDQNAYPAAVEKLSEIEALAATLELSSMEEEGLKGLRSDMQPIEEYANKNVSRDEVNSARVANVENSARYFATACQENADDIMTNSKQMHIAGDYAMMGIFLAVVIAILVVGHLVRKKEERIAATEEEAAIMESKAETAKQKTIDIAYKNLTMDCGNRFALDKLLESHLVNEPITLIQYEIADFPAILSMIGYSRMDAFMSKTAETIRSRFSNQGELFTLDGREFVFAFYPTIDAGTVQTVSEDLRAVIRVSLNTNLNMDSVIMGDSVFSSNYHTTDAVLTALYSATRRNVVPQNVPQNSYTWNQNQMSTSGHVSSNVTSVQANSGQVNSMNIAPHSPSLAL